MFFTSVQNYQGNIGKKISLGTTVDVSCQAAALVIELINKILWVNQATNILCLLTHLLQNHNNLFLVARLKMWFFGHFADLR